MVIDMNQEKMDQTEINEHLVRMEGGILRSQLRIITILEKITDDIEQLKKDRKGG